MGDLKWITWKEFEAYLRVKEFMEKTTIKRLICGRKFEIGDPLASL